MTPFEEQLRQAMAREQPREDFTRRVVERANRERAGEAGNRSVMRLWHHGWFHALPAWPPALRAGSWAAVIAALLLMSGSMAYEQHERAARGLAAKEKLLTAVRIAGVKLRQVHRQVLDVEATEVDQ